MLANTLNTNEIKNAAGTEVEFSRWSSGVRETEFKAILETPSSPHRLSIRHAESSTGLKLRRRSVVRFDKTVISSVDSVTPVVVSAYVVLDAPVGALTAQTEMANVLSELMSFLATTGAGTTVLFDGTGTGAVVLLDGSV
jgi:aspartate aminotransferase-like enzyme